MLKKISTLGIFILVASLPPRLCADEQFFGGRAVRLSTEDPASWQTCPLQTDSGLTALIHKGDRLYFSFGVLSSAYARWGVKYRFSVEISHENSSETAFIKDLNPQDELTDRGWQNSYLPLDPYAGETIRVKFKIEILSWHRFFSFLLDVNGARWGGVRLGSFERKPGDLNVIFISLDTLRPDHLSYNGYARPTSPNFDALAKQGVYFEEAIAASPWTKPSHMSIFTGLYPSTHKITHDHYEGSNAEELDARIPTLAEILQRNGFLTQAFTGAAYVTARFGFSRGFDRYGETAKPKNNDGPYVFESAKSWLKENDREKFFLFLHTYEIHDPYRHKFFAKLLDDPSQVARACANYDSGIRYADRLVGELIATLRDLQLLDKTLIVIFSDHGEELYQHGFIKDHNHTLYDELIRVPLLFYAPKKLGSRRIRAFQAQHVDIVPTVLNLLSIPFEPGQFQGVSLTRIMKGEEKPSQSVAFSEALSRGPEQKSIRFVAGREKRKLIWAPALLHDSDLAPFFRPFGKNRRFFKAPWNTLVLKAHGEQYFNLTTDPGEKKNLAQAGDPDKPRLAQQLRAFILAHPHDPSKRDTAGSHREPANTTDRDGAEKLRALGY